MSNPNPTPLSLATFNNYLPFLSDQKLEPARDMFYRCLIAGKYCDLKITCQNKTFEVHKIVISAHSKVLAAMIDSYFQEGHTSHIDLPEDDPVIIRLLIQFLYLGTYYHSTWRNSFTQKYRKYVVDGEPLSSDEYPPLEPLERISCRLHAQLYAVADKYDVPPLFNISVNNYRDRAIERGKGVSLKEEDFIDFLDSISTVYNTPSHSDGDDLRTLASNIMACFADDFEICARTSPALKELREQVMRDTPEFTLDVALKLMKNPSVVCGSCVDNQATRTDDYQLVNAYCSICGEKKAFCRNNSGNDLLE